MSDYLSRLAERLTAREPAIVPRARSRFEPDRPEPAEFAEIFEEQESESPRPARFVTPAASAEHPESYAPPAAAAFVDPPLPRSTGRAPARSLPTLREPVRPDAPARDDSHQPAPRYASSKHETLPALVELEPRTFRSTSATSGQVTISSTRVDEHVHAAPAAVARRPAAVPSSNTLPRSVPTAQQIPSPTPSGAEAETAGTTVEVSIGRIEIRQPAEPPRASKPARRAPRLTLERYLDERRGGRR